MPEKDKHDHIPVERHDTAPLAEIHKVKHISQVTIPSKPDIEHAKDYVDTNEK